MIRFSPLKRLIEAADEKAFYDVALIYLREMGYQGLSIVDGKNDGGRDVVSDRADLGIQLSVAKDWKSKLNLEASKCLNRGKRSFQYITNRRIPIGERDLFFSSGFALKGQVEVQVIDSDRLATMLLHTSTTNGLYEALGISIKPTKSQTHTEKALSYMMLFGVEATAARDDFVDATLIALINQRENISENELIRDSEKAIARDHGGIAIRRSISRLRQAGRIYGPAESIRLSTSELARADVALAELETSKRADLNTVISITGVTENEAEILLEAILAYHTELNSNSKAVFSSDKLNAILSEMRLAKPVSDKLKNVIPKLNLSSRYTALGLLTDLISSDSADIYRALGNQDEVRIIIDSSVAMPLLIGAEYTSQKTRYHVSASGLLETAKKHGLTLNLPQPYLNEAAAHALKAVERSKAASELIKSYSFELMESENAFVAAYAGLVENKQIAQLDTTFEDFLAHFGARPGTSIARCEDRLRGLFADHGVEVSDVGRYEKGVYLTIKELKAYEPEVLVEHDARVCSYLKSNDKVGFMFATWDRTILEVLRNDFRVHADRPSRLVDLLSLIRGTEITDQSNLDFSASIAHLDFAGLAATASKLDEIKEAEVAFKVREILDRDRSSQHSSWKIDAQKVSDAINAV